jgi:hypothetical protein
MPESRRRFILFLVAFAGCLTAGDSLLFAQRQVGFPDPPQPAEKQNPAAA